MEKGSDNVKIFDLQGLSGHVDIQGTYERVIIKNADGVHIDASGLKIYPFPKVDPIAFQNMKKAEIYNYKGPGPITVWGDIENLVIRDCWIELGNAGIRLSQHSKTEKYGSISIVDCVIKNVEHEGIYIGNHAPTDYPVIFVEVLDTIVKNTGWDGIQIGNTKHFRIKDCVVLNAAKSEQWGQDGFIQINPGAEGHIINSIAPGQWNILGTAFIKNERF